MEFLVRCRQCGCYAAPAHFCPDADAPPAPVATEHVEEWRRRLIRHRRHYTKYMALLLAWTALTALLEIRALTFDRYWAPVENILTIHTIDLGWFFLGFAIDFLVLLAWLLLSACAKHCRDWWPIELQCPRCEVRLDEIGGAKLAHCPGCQLWLGGITSPPRPVRV